MQFHFFYTLYFIGKTIQEEVKNTTDPYNAFMTSWKFATTFAF